MASVNPMNEAAGAEQGAADRRTGRGLVVLLWILVMVPLLWGVMMTLRDVQKFFQ
jgi:hypothetical protein